MEMELKEALKIVLDLAEQSILTDDQAKGGMEEEQARQDAAHSAVRIHLETLSEDSFGGKVSNLWQVLPKGNKRD